MSFRPDGCCGQSWPIDVPLTNRAGMTSRMLLGRQPLTESHTPISPTEKRLQPEPELRRLRHTAPYVTKRRSGPAASPLLKP